MWKAKIVVLLTWGFCLLYLALSSSQGQPPPPLPQDPNQNQMPLVPNGVDVQARGPVHEAFAAPTNDPQEPPIINRKPPAPLDEMPPAERPEGDMVWIGGYYHYDDDRNDYLWVSGCWRAKPQGREWIPGYWREQNGGWQWVGGFWAEARDNKISEIVYQPAPPAPPQVAPPGNPPMANAFYKPGGWVWYQSGYRWQAGFWTQSQPGYVYVAPYYRWTPRGYVYIQGHWDLIMARRGLLYAPVVVNAGMVGPGFVYTPSYAVGSAFIVDSMFIRPAYCHYYFGDYYGQRYNNWGYTSCLIYGRGYYDPFIAYQRCYYPAWYGVQINLFNGRIAGRIALPPRRMVDINFRLNPHFIAPGRTIVAFHGGRSIGVTHQDRLLARDHAVAVRNQAHAERARAEVRGAGHGAHQIAGGGIRSRPQIGPRAGPANHPQTPQKHTPPQRQPPRKENHKR